MSKVNLGKVAMLPWINLYDFFEYPPTDKVNIVGGYKEYKGKCYILFSSKFKANTTLIFPKPKSPFDIQLLKNGVVTTVNFNGTINGSINDEIATGGTYVYTT